MVAPSTPVGIGVLGKDAGAIAAAPALVALLAAGACVATGGLVVCVVVPAPLGSKTFCASTMRGRHVRNRTRAKDLLFMSRAFRRFPVFQFPFSRSRFSQPRFSQSRLAQSITTICIILINEPSICNALALACQKMGNKKAA